MACLITRERLAIIVVPLLILSLGAPAHAHRHPVSVRDARALVPNLRAHSRDVSRSRHLPGRRFRDVAVPGTL